jgi:arylsulfatase A-like enzyme
MNSIKVLLIFGILFCTLFPWSSSGKGGPAKPNIVFIMADDMGYGDAGAFGQVSIQTPNIDKLARDGMVFTQCYAGSTVCAPSRSTLMTGLHTGHTRVRGNTSQVPLDLPNPRRLPLEKDDVTVAEVLKEAGYVCGMFGKWGLGEPNTTGEPNSQGFDEWFGFLNQRHAHTHYPDYLWENRDTFPIPDNNTERYQHTHELFTKRAVSFIKDNRGSNFFLYVPYTLPHDEFEATDEFLKLYRDSNWTDRERTYAAMVSMVDDGVGKIVESLKQWGVRNNTLIMFCSDNGAANRYDGRFNSSGELRGRKRDMYEGGLRTPMIVNWPGIIPQGRNDELVWYFADVMPTLAGLARAKVPDNLDGISVLPAFFGQEWKSPERFLYWEFPKEILHQAVRWKNWKAVRYGVNGKLELYDLSTDLSEENDVSDDYPGIVRIIEDYLLTARTETDYWVNE